jgi:hypothetical protein
VLGTASRCALVGIAIGPGCRRRVFEAMSTLLHDVKPLDPPTFVAVALSLTAVAIAASLVPAWRARAWIR